jgi:hypothetical protein
MQFDEMKDQRSRLGFAVGIQAIRSKKSASEKILTIRFTSQLTRACFSPPNSETDQAPKKTKTLAAMTTVAQKTPMPAITTPWWVRSDRGETSGIRIFLDFSRNAIGTSVEHRRCHIEESQRR